MTSFDLDRIHEDRLKELEDGVPSNRAEMLSTVFVGERILQTIDRPKLVIEGYRLSKLLPMLAFTPVLYVKTCPGCFSATEDVDRYISLFRHELIIPVLTAPYDYFPESLVEELRTRDHVSTYEYGWFTDIQLHDISRGRRLCDHCFDGRKDRIVAKIKGVRGATRYKELVASAAQSLQPPIYPDYELLDEIEQAVKDRKIERLQQLAALARAVSEIRTAQVWNSALALNAFDFIGIPDNISVELDETRRMSMGLSKFVADGLGIRVPIDIPIDRWAELIRYYRPRIISIIDEVVDKSGGPGAGYEEISKQISHLNNEISRLKGLRRHMLLEAVAEPLRRNKALVLSSVVAGALGLGGSLVGCIGAMFVGGTISAGKKTKIGADLANPIYSP